MYWTTSKTRSVLPGVTTKDEVADRYVPVSGSGDAEREVSVINTRLTTVGTPATPVSGLVVY